MLERQVWGFELPSLFPQEQKSPFFSASPTLTCQSLDFPLPLLHHGTCLPTSTLKYCWSSHLWALQFSGWSQARELCWKDHISCKAPRLEVMFLWWANTTRFSAGYSANHLPRCTALWWTHPNLSALSMRYLGIQHQTKLGLVSSESLAASMNGLSCEHWRGESVFALLSISLFLSFSPYFFSINMRIYIYIWLVSRLKSRYKLFKLGGHTTA